MPIYEFKCEKCGQEFEELVRSASETDELFCPNCDHQNVKKMMSTFAAQFAGASMSNSWKASSGSCDTGST